MTYQRLYESVHTAKAQEEANRLRYFYGFETEASEDDVEHVHAIEHIETGGC